MARIAIDTNVFIHLTNPQNNPESHIDHLLMHLAKKQPRLCVDSTYKIGNEYEEKLGPRIKDSNDTSLAIYLLRFWMHPDLRDVIETDLNDLLMHRIRQAIPEVDENADRAFVYVSCKGDCFLVSNDDGHIYSRRGELKDKTRKLRGDNWRIVNSQEAIGFLVQSNPIRR
jgi:hypothetical protein